MFVCMCICVSLSLSLVMWRYMRCCDFDFSPSFPIGRQL